MPRRRARRGRGRIGRARARAAAGARRRRAAAAAGRRAARRGGAAAPARARDLLLGGRAGGADVDLGATVVRCAQRLGFKGFHDLKVTLADQLAGARPAHGGPGVVRPAARGARPGDRGGRRDRAGRGGARGRRCVRRERAGARRRAARARGRRRRLGGAVPGRRRALHGDRPASRKRRPTCTTSTCGHGCWRPATRASRCRIPGHARDAQDRARRGRGRRDDGGCDELRDRAADAPGGSRARLRDARGHAAARTARHPPRPSCAARLARRRRRAARRAAHAPGAGAPHRPGRPAGRTATAGMHSAGATARPASSGPTAPSSPTSMTRAGAPAAGDVETGSQPRHRSVLPTIVTAALACLALLPQRFELLPSGPFLPATIRSVTLVIAASGCARSRSRAACRAAGRPCRRRRGRRRRATPARGPAAHGRGGRRKRRRPGAVSPAAA